MGIRQIVRRVLIVLPPVRRRAAYLAALNAERDLLQYRLNEARQQLEHTEAEKNAAFQREQRLRGEFAIESARYRQNLEASHNAMREASGRHRNEAEHDVAVRQELALVNQQAVVTRLALKAALSESADLGERVQSLATQLSDARIANADLGVEAATLRGERAGLDKVCEGQRIEIRTLGLEIERLAAAARREAGRFDEQQSTARYALDKALQRAENLSQQISELGGQIARLEGELSVLKDQNARLTAVNAQYGLEKTSLAETLTVREARLAVMEQDRAELDNRMHNIDSAIASAEAERDELKARLNAAIASEAATREQLAQTAESEAAARQHMEQAAEALRSAEERRELLDAELKSQVEKADAAQVDAAALRERASDRIGALSEAFEQRIAELGREIAELETIARTTPSKAPAKTVGVASKAMPDKPRRVAAKPGGA